MRSAVCCALLELCRDGLAKTGAAINTSQGAEADQERAARGMQDPEVCPPGGIYRVSPARPPRVGRRSSVVGRR